MKINVLAVCFIKIFALSLQCMCKDSKMYRLNLPPFEIKIRETNGRHSVWDILRRKYVALTPEEWVRQHFVHYLIGHKGYPQSLLANETELRMGAKRLRCDTVLYDKLLHPRMIMEYKAPAIALSQRVFNQISVYNLLLKVDYLVVSNGLQHVACQMDYERQTYHFLEDIPFFNSL